MSRCTDTLALLAAAALCSAAGAASAEPVSRPTNIIIWPWPDGSTKFERAINPIRYDLLDLFPGGGALIRLHDLYAAFDIVAFDCDGASTTLICEGVRVMPIGMAAKAAYTSIDENVEMVLWRDENGQIARHDAGVEPGEWISCSNALLQDCRATVLRDEGIRDFGPPTPDVSWITVGHACGAVVEVQSYSPIDSNAFRRESSIATSLLIEGDLVIRTVANGSDWDETMAKSCKTATTLSQFVKAP